MGIDYSLCLIINRADSGTLLPHLSTLLDADSRARIASIEWSPETESVRRTLIGTTETDARGIASFSVSDTETSNSYCFSLDVKLERELESLVPDHRFQCFDQKSPFGCLWTSIFAGKDYVLLEMTAATSGMSRVIQQSQVIQSKWTGLAKSTDALFAYIDVEESVAIQLFPTHGDLVLPDYDTLAYDGDCRFSVDRMVAYLLATAGG